MNRELKFRAFSNGKMVMLDQITFTEKVWLCKGGNGLSIPYQPHRAVMQYTGIKDKNGVDIYEGDVVKKTYGQSFIKKRLNENIGVVEICEYEVIIDSFGLSYTVTGWNIEFSDKSGRTAINSDYEVIGNIHEHPELLNG